MAETEVILVDRLRNKDRRAFELVFNEYYSTMVNYAMRFMDLKEDAEEAVQEVFVKFWEKCETLALDSSIKSYLYRSVHNTCLNQLKHEKVKDSYRQYVINYMEDSFEDEYFGKSHVDIHQLILKEVNNLPPRCSEIFKLSRYEGLRYQEIADHLEISVKTVEVQMGKALKVLRAKFKDHNPQD